MPLVPIPDYEDLYSFDTDTNQVWGHKMKIYIREQQARGYFRTQLSKNGIKKWFQLHRLVYQAHNGKIPEGLHIDHIDNNKTNNDISNLRLATRSENSCNIKKHTHNTIGYKNICEKNNKRYKSYQVHIYKNKKKYSKTFKTLEEAIEYRNIKLLEIHGEFANFG
jgi:hypothetical protein